LITVIQSLKGTPPPDPVCGSGSGVDQFDATALIRRELHSGLLLKSLLTDEPGDATILEICNAVSSLGESGGGLARELSRFLSALPGDIQGSVATPDVAVEVELSAPRDAGEVLAGALFSSEPTPAAVLLLRLLWRFAGAGISLTVMMGRPGREPLRIALVQQPVSSDDVLDALREVFERWDVAAR
jgi:hypothetical protein